MSDVLVRVGDYELTNRDLDDFIASLPREQQMYKDIPQFRAQVQDRLEEICLFAMYGSEEKLEESEDYKAAMAAAKRDILGQLAVHNMIKNIEVSDEEAKDFYEANKKKFGKAPSASAKHILVDSEEKAKDIMTEIAEEKKTFEEAAKEYSSCPSSAKGGDLGTFGPGQMVKEFDEAVFTGEVNKVLGPVKTQFGYHLIYITERTEGETPSFDEVKDMAKREASRAKEQDTYDAKVKELRAKYIAE